MLKNLYKILFLVLIFYTISIFSYHIFLDELKGYISLFFFNSLLIFFLIFFKRNFIFSFLMFLYFLMFNLAIFVDYSELYLINISKNSIYYIILPILCFILLIPILFLKRPNLDKILYQKHTLYFSIFIGLAGLLSLIYLSPYTVSTFVQGAKDVRNSLQENSVLPSNIFTTFSVGVSMFYPIFIFLIFYGLIRKINKLIIFLLIMGVISGAVGGIIFAARDRFLWIPLFFIINYWMWYPYLNLKLRKKIKTMILIFCIFSLIFLVLFTVNRFLDSQTGVLGSILVYFGAQPYIFAETVEQHNSNLFYGLNLRFPLFVEMLGFDSNPSIRDTPYQWMFGTLFSDFYMMGGWSFIIIFISIVNALYIYIYKYYKESPWIYIMMFMLHIQILTQGIFYFSLGFSGGNFYILLTVLLAITLNLLSRSKL